MNMTQKNCLHDSENFSSGISDLDLWEIYRRKSIKAGVRRQLAEDLASEMYALGLERERKKGVSRFNMTFKWLFWSAWRQCTYRIESKSKTGWVRLNFGYHPFYGQGENRYIDFSAEAYEQWLCSIWQDTSNRSGGRFLKKYRVTCNAIELELTGPEIREISGKLESTLSDSQVVGNIKRRGMGMYLIQGDIWRDLSDAARFYKVTVPALVEKFEIEQIKIFVK